MNAEQVQSLKALENLCKIIKPMCPVCETDENIEFIEGCKHHSCRSCLEQHILLTNYPPRCPVLYLLPMIPCPCIIEDNQCFNILEKENHVTFNQKRLMRRYMDEENLYPCYGEKCKYPVKRNGKNQCECVRCGAINCYSCGAIHKQHQTCEMWEADNLEIVKGRNLLKLFNEEKIAKNEGMYCPKCKMFFEITQGCDAVRCEFCLLDICFLTKQARWGPQGIGDISGGCKCMVNGIKCHKNCKSCH